MKTFGLLGRSLSHSFSKKYFLNKFSHIGMNAQYIEWETDSLADFRKLFFEKDMMGLNVTIPYKEEVIPYLDVLSPESQEIGAVNCIERSKNKKLIGHNTDWVGFKMTLKSLNIPQGTNALILGDGGAAKAIKYALQKEGIPFDIVSRNGTITYKNLSQEMIQSHKLIINTTPLGMFPNIETKPDIPYEAIDSKHIGIDLVYNPAETEFLSQIKNAHGKTENGYKMLITQAEASWAIWNQE